MEPFIRKFCFHCGVQFGVTKETLQSHKALFCPVGHKIAVMAEQESESIKNKKPLHVEFIELRKELGYSQKDAAEHIGVSSATVSRFERLGETALTNGIRKRFVDFIAIG